jgi:hypothetical protein
MVDNITKRLVKVATRTRSVLYSGDSAEMEEI